MKFLIKRKIKQLQKIFPNAVIVTDIIVTRSNSLFLEPVSKKTVYSVSDLTLEGLTVEQTKELEKKRLRITSIDFDGKTFLLQRKLKVFDWFVVYTIMRISFGVLLLYLGNQLL